MGKKKEDGWRQSGGINIEGSNVVTKGDAVGRDKIEKHKYYKKDPFRAWETFYAGGCLAKTLIILGTIILIAGFLTFAGTILIAITSIATIITSIATTSTDTIPGAFAEVGALTPFIAVGFGAFLVGMLTLALGQAMAQHSAHRQRRNSPRQTD
jgi:uncharacterized membrane protein YkgB